MTEEALIAFPLVNAPGFVVQEEPAAHAYKCERGVADSDVPWWAVALLHLTPGGPEAKVRSMMQRGLGDSLIVHNWRDAYFDIWCMVVAEARKRVRPWKPEKWVEEAYVRTASDGGKDHPHTENVRRAALSCPRAYAQLTQLADNRGQTLGLKDFHVRTIWAMRQERIMLALLPYSYGKSFLSTIVVPLMDWGDWPDAREGRIYLSEDAISDWPARLQHEVEHNDALHQLFPWIRKPRRGDAAYGTWNNHKFAIGGRMDKRPSFEAMTLKQFRVGKRFDRLLGDDWVNSDNCDSVEWQERFYQYLLHDALSMREQPFRKGSRAAPSWGTYGHLGTVYDANDVNKRAYEHFREMGYRVLRFDVFPRGQLSIARKEVLWPEERPFASVMALRDELQLDAFNKRCRNMVSMFRRVVFAEEEYDAAEEEELQFGQPPADTSLLIGFDPGRGRISRHSRNPAWMLYGENRITEDVHLIAWGRLEGYSFPKQCGTLVELARMYHCPVAVEINNIQTAYAEQIDVQAHDVAVICHTTNANKRDPKDGIETFVPLFEKGRIRIHVGDAPTYERRALRDEFTRYPTFKFTDLLMAAWVARYQQRLRCRQERRPQIITGPVPAYARRLSTSRTYDISASKHRYLA
jgi:hypothetical protein